MTKVNIDLWVLLVGVALPSACLLLISISYCWRRLTRRKSKAGADTSGFNQQVLLEMVLQQTDDAFNSIVDTVYKQRVELLTLLETQKVKSHLSTKTSTPPAAATQPLATETSPTSEAQAVPTEAGNPPQTAAATNIRSKKTAAIFDPYSQIPEQIQQGLSVGEVASRLNLPESAVELYVKLRLSTQKDGRQKSA